MRLLQIVVGLLFYIATLNTASAQDSKGQVIDEIIAVVGGEIIMKSDMQNRMSEMKKEGFAIEGEAECAIMEEILYQRLLINQAKIDSMVVTEDEINSQLERRLDFYISQFPSVEDFKAFYGKSPAQLKEEFRGDVKDQLLTQKMQQQITQNASITPNEVRRFYNKIPKDSLPLIESEVQYSQIVMRPKVQPAQEQEVKESLVGYKTDLESSPFKFGIYATLYSDDPGSANSQNQGCYRTVERGTMVPEFEQAVLNLQPGQITEPFKTDFGWHIARLEEKSGKYYSVCHILKKIETLEIDNQIAQKELENVRDLILSDSLTFKLAATIYSQDKDTRKAGGQVPNPYTGGTKHEVSKLDPKVTLILNQLKPGEISEPVMFESQSGSKEYRIFILESRSDAHVASMAEDYPLLKQLAENELRNKQLEAWIQKKLAITYKRLNDEYKTCTYRYDWAVN